MFANEIHHPAKRSQLARKNPVIVMSSELFDMDADKEIQISSMEYSLVCHISEVSAIDCVSKLFGVSIVDINLM